MYRILLLIIIIALVGWIIWLNKNKRIDNKSINGAYQSFLDLIKFKDGMVLNSLRILSYQITWISFILLALTAFLPIIILGGHLSGFPLILHVTIAPVFCVALALSAIFWAHSQRLFSSDWLNLKSRFVEKIFSLKDGIKSWQKIYFWLFLIFSIPAILSIVLGMYPFFGTEGQANLILIHSYSTLILFIIASLHTLGTVAVKDKSKK
jgi:hypothetical protein